MDIQAFCKNFTKKPVRFQELYPKEYKVIYENTQFLPDKCPIKQRFWHIINGNDYPKCGVCGNHITKWNTVYKNYSSHCSSKCANRSESKKARIKQTQHKKYGGHYNATDQAKQQRQSIIQSRTPERIQEIKEKTKQTNIERYGVEHVSQSNEIKEKTKQTNIERYGVEHVFQSKEIREKIKQTNINKFGCTSPMQNADVVDKFKRTMQNKYDVVSFKQLSYDEDTRIKLQSKDWMVEQHHCLKKTQLQIAEDLNVNPTTVGRWLHKHDIDKKYYFTSTEQVNIETWLCENNVEFLSNDRTTLSGKEIDIYIPELKIGIEYCGLFWHSDIHSRITKHTHAEKYQQCHMQGIRLLTIFQNEWIQQQTIVKNKVLEILKLNDNNKINARHCVVVEPTKKQKNVFLNANHIQGTDKSNICYALEHNGAIVSMMTGTVHCNVFNISRYSTLLNNNVRGGFSKLCSHVEKTVQPTYMTTFADLRWSNGDLYKNTGFNVESIISPTFYCYIPSTQRLLHRSNFMKHKLIHKHGFDETMTEFKMQDALGIRRVWDCGKIKFVKKCANV